MRKIVGMTRYISCAICTLLLFLSLASGNTFSFQEGSQRARNDAQNLSSKANVRLIKFENDTGEKLSGAVFSLYKTDGTLLFENLVTDENGEIFAAVTAGDYYFEEQTPPEGYDFMRDENNAPVTCHPFTVTEAQEQNGETIELTVENRKAKVGTLTITKIVQNSDGSALTEAQSGQEFNFTVTFSVGGSYYFTVQNSNGEEVRHGTLESGKKVMLRHGESAKFYSVPAENNWYSVTETQTDGYTSTSTGEAGWVIESGSEAAFTNIYTVPAPPEPTPDPTPTPETEPATEPEPAPKPDSDVPQTDDSRKPVLWLSLIVIGVAGLCCCGLYVKKHLRRRKKRTDK